MSRRLTCKFCDISSKRSKQQGIIEKRGHSNATLEQDGRYYIGAQGGSIDSLHLPLTRMAIHKSVVDVVVMVDVLCCTASAHYDKDQHDKLVSSAVQLCESYASTF